MPPPDDLTALFHRRWAVPVLAELHRLDGAKFVTLVRRLGTSPGSMRSTLDALMELDLVMRNPGYGHPLRPEYILTDEGVRIAPACGKLVDELRSRGLEDMGFRKWSMPALLALGDRTLRFGEIRDRLGAVTDRALTRALKDLMAAELIERRVRDDFPPVARYVVRPGARRLLESLRLLGRGEAARAGR